MVRRISTFLLEEEALLLGRSTSITPIILRDISFSLKGSLCKKLKLKDARILLHNPQADSNNLLICSARRGWILIITSLLEGTNLFFEGTHLRTTDLSINASFN